MEKEFIGYSEALALKELGFDEPCMYIFDKQRNNLMCPIYGLFENEEPNRFLNAPLYQQAFRWFREKYGLFSNLDVIDNCATFYYEYQIVNHKDTEFYHDGHQARRLWNNLEFRTYEEAELECLKKLIEIVKQK